MLYIFMSEDEGVYGYTDNKKIAKDFNEINDWRLKMRKADNFSKELLIPGGDISYYTLIGDNKEKFTVPLTENEAHEILNRCIHIHSRFIYAKHELSFGNKFGFKNKYLNVINGLTNVLTKESYKEDLTNLFHISGRSIDSYKDINSLKIYNDLCTGNKKYL